ncbi:MAG TPA: tryptophan 2,3-dioxygenase family protein [Dehalococcoidia bacterium]|nr:tryptophan 2,3-dioxygenase family protein [Dehalococcoidia bacterium]
MAFREDASQAAYGSGAPLSYNKYLRVPDLIRLQEPLSDPAHHDELLFITIHQTYELWFKQILHEIDASIAFIERDQVTQATRALARVVEIEKILYQQIHLLETMTPLGFLQFRDKLNPASGFQSMQFREIEFVSGLKDEGILGSFADDQYAHKRLTERASQHTLGDAFYSLLRRNGFDVDTASDEEAYRRRVRAMVEVLTHFETRAAEFELADKLLEHDEYFALWRLHHIKMVERMVGSKRGTGGSEGIGYLQTTLAKKFFPEIWEARTHLDSAHDMSTCPFGGGGPAR